MRAPRTEYLGFFLLDFFGSREETSESNGNGLVTTTAMKTDRIIESSSSDSTGFTGLYLVLKKKSSFAQTGEGWAVFYWTNVAG